MITLLLVFLSFGVIGLVISLVALVFVRGTARTAVRGAGTIAAAFAEVQKNKDRMEAEKPGSSSRDSALCLLTGIILAPIFLWIMLKLHIISM